MIFLEKGKTYTAAMVRTGTSQRGDWEMVKIVDGKNELTIWPDNKPSGVEEGGEFEVVEITGVKYGPRKNKQGVWQKEGSVTAILKPFKSAGASFTIDDVDGDVPFEVGDNPFAPGGMYSLPEEDQLPL